MRHEYFTGTLGFEETESSKPGQMTCNDENPDLTSFLPSFWSKNLNEVPLLGSKFKIIELDERFIEFIESDGLTLDDENQYTSTLSDSDETSETDSDNSAKYFKPSEKFPELHEILKSAIEILGGAVVPKLNWTVPKDSIWISANTLKCTSANEVYQLLKASDRIQSDLELLKQLNITPQLFLRPFVEISHECEFRVFVFDGDIIAISQRNLDIFDPSLIRNSQSIITKISTFHDKYFHNFNLLRYSFDVYISDEWNSVFLTDVNPLTECASTLLFKYSELEKLSNQTDHEIIFKCIERNEDTIIGLCERNFLPIDLLNASSSDITNIDFNNLPQ